MSDRLKRAQLNSLRVLLLVVVLASQYCSRADLSSGKVEAGPSRGPVSAIPFVTIAKGDHSAITTPRQAVIRTNDEWRALWSEHVAGLAPSPPLPSADFRTGMLIALFRGNTEGGFPITITEIIKGTTEVVVFFEKLSPPPRFPLGVGGIRQSYHIVQVERIPLPVVFQERSRDEKGEDP